MERIKRLKVFEQDANIRTKAFTGVPHYPIVAEYLGLVTKFSDSGAMSQLTPFLKAKSKPDQPQNSIILLHFIDEILVDIKEAQPDLYAKLNADSFLQKIKDVTPK
jgi:hypothetical protein